MVLDLRRIFANEGESLTIDTEFDFSDTELYGGYPLKKPVKAVGRVFNRASIVTLDLVCTVEYSASCDRCLEPIVKTYTIPIKRTLVTKLFGEPNDEIIQLTDYKLELKELCFTEVIVGIPNKHLCREDCKGLCPVCGKNLNFGECDCKTESVDPRLADLAQFLN